MVISYFQRWLASHGFNPGPADGIFGLKTANAYRDFLQTLPSPQALSDFLKLPPIIDEVRFKLISEIPSRADKELYYGKFRYQDMEGGRINIIDPTWKQNLIRVQVAPATNKTFHKKAAPYLVAAFAELAWCGNLPQRADTWVPRHMQWNPSKHLSNHSWGIAIDIDPQQNTAKYVASDEEWKVWLQQSTNYQSRFLDATVFNGTVSYIMRRWGFSAGGEWPGHRYPANGFCDPMHFELVRP